MFQTIVLAYDGSAECRDALTDGIALATRFSARCHLLAVVPPMNSMAIASGYMPEGLLDSEQAHYNGILEGGVSRLRQAGVQATGTLKTWVDPSQAIGAFAQETGADLVVIGHHRRSTLERWWRGSVGHHLLDHLPCSLLVSMHDDAAKRAVAGSDDT